MSALRAFRFQKNKPSTPPSSQSSLASGNGSSDIPASINGYSNGNGSISHDDSSDSIQPPFGKRPRLDVGSGSESGSPIKVNNGHYVTPKSFGWGLEICEEFKSTHTYPAGEIWKDRIASGSITFLP